MDPGLLLKDLCELRPGVVPAGHQVDRPDDGQCKETGDREDPDKPDPQWRLDVLRRYRGFRWLDNPFEQRMTDVLSILGPRFDAKVPRLGDPAADFAVILAVV